MLSPRLNLKMNAIMYQEMMAIPPEESDPDIFEDHARQLKERWDRQGQGDFYSPVGDHTSPDLRQQGSGGHADPP
jgi:hypothetical protein